MRLPEASGRWLAAGGSRWRRPCPSASIRPASWSPRCWRDVCGRTWPCRRPGRRPHACGADRRGSTVAVAAPRAAGGGAEPAHGPRQQRLPRRDLGRQPPRRRARRRHRGPPRPAGAVPARRRRARRGHGRGAAAPAQRAPGGCARRGGGGIGRPDELCKGTAGFRAKAVVGSAIARPRNGLQADQRSWGHLFAGAGYPVMENWRREPASSGTTSCRTTPGGPGQGDRQGRRAIARAPAVHMGGSSREETHVPYIKVGQENSGSIDLHYEDHGSGTPVVLIHGYPLSGRAWDKQVPVLLEAGHRVITYDRRGFGNSSQPAVGYDYDTFAADLNTLMNTLDLQQATLVGHSMGTGEVTRYLSAYGSERVSKGVLVSPIPPFLLQTGDNPEGLPGSLFDGFIQNANADGPAWMKGFLDNFYNLDVLGGTLVSDQAYQASWNIAAAASAIAAVACIPTWETDFRDDLPRIDVPVLVVQGDADRILPFPNTGKRLPGLIKDMQLVVIDGGPHAIAWTHADQVNNALRDFLA